MREYTIKTVAACECPHCGSENTEIVNRYFCGDDDNFEEVRRCGDCWKEYTVWYEYYVSAVYDRKGFTNFWQEPDGCI